MPEERPAVTILHVGGSGNSPKPESSFWVDGAVDRSVVVPSVEPPPLAAPSDAELQKTLVLVANTNNRSSDSWRGHTVAVSMSSSRLYLNLQSAQFLRGAPAVLLYYSEQYNEIVIEPRNKRTLGTYLVDYPGNKDRSSTRIQCAAFLRKCPFDKDMGPVRYVAWPGERGGPLESCLRVSLQQRNVLV